MKKIFFTAVSLSTIILATSCTSGTSDTSTNDFSQADPSCVALVEEAKSRYIEENITDPNNTGLRFLDEAIVGCTSFDTLVASSGSIQEIFPENTTVELFLLSRCTTAEKPEVKESRVCQESSKGLLNLGQ